MIFGRKNKNRLAKIIGDRLEKVTGPEQFQEFLDSSGTSGCWYVGDLEADLMGLYYKPTWLDSKGVRAVDDEHIVISFGVVRKVCRRVAAWFPEAPYIHYVALGLRIPKVVAEKTLVLGFLP
jgi:hypothetical protein